MTRTERRDALAAEMPPELRVVYDRQRAAGNELIDFEIGRGEHEGRMLLVMDHPFRAEPAPLPAGVTYRETHDREPMLFEFVTADGRWSLATVKLKPMKLEPLAVPDQRATQDVARQVRAQEVAANPPSAPQTLAKMTSDEKSLDPTERFMASLRMDYDKWHDGTGYDLDALAKMPPEQRPAIEAMLLARRPLDWRDVEALAQFDTPAARAAVRDAAESADPRVRRVARECLPPEASDPLTREARLIANLRDDELLGGLGLAIEEAAEFHPPAVIDELIRGVLARPGPPAVHFAALLYFIHGKAAEPFDWAHRPFYLRFDGTSGPAAHLEAFIDLCAMIGVDAAKFSRR